MRGKSIAVALGFCCSLTCQSDSSYTPVVTTERSAETARLARTPTASAPLPPDSTTSLASTSSLEAAASPDWIARTWTDVNRTDVRLAAMAVSRVATSDASAVLRLDTALLGQPDGLARLLADGGLVVHQAKEFWLVEAPSSGHLRDRLRELLPALRAGIERQQDNLLRQHVVGGRAAYGSIERLLTCDDRADALNGIGEAGVDFRQGSVRSTGRALDVAIQGPGLLVFKTSDGRLLYSRDGQLRLDEGGRIVSRTVPGAALYPTVAIPSGAAEVAVVPGGEVRARLDGQPEIRGYGRIALAWFEHPERLHAIQPAFFARMVEAGEIVEDFPGEADLGLLAHGCLEDGNVNPVDCWRRVCRLEDTRQIIIAAIAEADGHEPTDGRQSAQACGGRPQSRLTSSQEFSADPAPPAATVAVTTPQIGWGAYDSELGTILRVYGLNAWSDRATTYVERNGDTADALVAYLKFLRMRLEVIGENVAHANDACDARAGHPYRRRVARLTTDGKTIVEEDLSPPRVQTVSDPTSNGTNSRRYLPHLDVDREMAEEDAVSREYRSIRTALVRLEAEAVPALVRTLRESSVAAPSLREDPSVARAIRENLSAVRVDAASTLGQMGGAAVAAVPALIESLKSGDWELVKASAHAIERISPDSDLAFNAVIGAYVTALNNPDTRQRWEAVAALARLGARAKPALPHLIRLLEDPTSGAAWALGCMGAAAAPATPNLTQALRRPDADVRRQAADALGRIGPAASEAVPALVSAMADRDPEVRWRAAAAIGRIGAGASGCESALKLLLSFQDGYVRSRVGEALGWSAPSQGPAASRTAAKHPANRVTPHASNKALLSLLSASPLAHTAAITAVGLTDDWRVRVRASAAFARLGLLPGLSLRMLTRMMEDEVAEVAVAAIEAIGRWGPKAAPCVPQLAVALVDPRPTVREQAALALGRIGNAAAAAAPVLAAGLTDGQPAVAAACARALSKIGPDAAETALALQAQTDHPNPKVRRAVSMALSRIGASASPKNRDGRREAVAGASDATVAP